jgi:S-adenosylmethionine:tRNA ribosyltransferase-isomerase
MRVADFDYDLPEGRIAERPMEPRDTARLLVAGDHISDHIVRDLSQLLRPHDVLVFNDTKVIPARLFGQRGTVNVECLLHQRHDEARWSVFARPAKRLKVGDTLTFHDDFYAEVEGRNEQDGTVRLKFNHHGPALFAAFEKHGHMPLPPYIKRVDDAADRTQYQTMFAAKEGAVAAPTASLHYTPELLKKLSEAGIGHTTLTLHVGAGTFMPVKVEDTKDHIMHAEWCELSQGTVATLNAAKAQGGRIIAVGTTAMRTLETAARSGSLQPYSGETRLFIEPGFQFHAVDGLLTNFHLPKSTLLMLVAAFVGMPRMKAIYAHAIEQNYRFYSYGDTSLLWPNGKN